MPDITLGTLEIRGPLREDVFDVYEAVDESSSDPADHVYSCVALCRKDWRRDWPALGGTRWVQGREPGVVAARGTARREAIELAMSMYIKNSLLRNAERSLGRSAQLFNWQGGKGVIWTPPGEPLSPHRLICHGHLVNHLRGEYIASKDIGVGTSELKWISSATRFTIGLGCLKDTGEATATGVRSGLRTAAAREFGREGSERPLEGLSVLVIGAGKVGFPLIGFLHEEGADVHVYDPGLEPSPKAVHDWCEAHEDPEASGEERRRHAAAFEEIRRRGGLFLSEREALEHEAIQIVSPNGGRAGWLSRPVSSSEADGRTRAEILAETRARHGNLRGNLRLILGAGNDQVPTTAIGRPERDRALAALAAAGIAFVPDPLVSPGGVIAVSHELAPKWRARAVNDDTASVVRRSVEQVYKESEQRGGTDAVRMYEAFEALTEQEWI